jgi:hypothetical protein
LQGISAAKVPRDTENGFVDRMAAMMYSRMPAFRLLFEAVTAAKNRGPYHRPALLSTQRVRSVVGNKIAH